MDNKLIETAFKTTLEGLLITDINAKIIEANSAIERCLGYKINKLKGKSIGVFIPEYLKEIHIKHHNSFYNDNTKQSHLANPREVIGQHKDGRLIPLEIRLNMFSYKGNSYTKVHISDISERKEKEKLALLTKNSLKLKIQEKNEKLNSVVKELQSTNNILELEIEKRKLAKKKLQKSLVAEKELGRLKNNFISLASHEFRTPLSGILTSAVLLDKYITNNSLSTDKHLGIIKSLVKHLNTILDDFLSLERIEKGDIRYEYSTFKLEPLLNDVVNEAKTFSKNGQVFNYKSCEDCTYIYQDRKTMYIILTNLLFNAIKYSAENTSIDIVVEYKKDIIIHISDQGIGIPIKDQKYIFKRFFRASNTTHLQGTGIGLNIVKSNIEALGGSISFNSIENKGTHFILRIPRTVDSMQNIKGEKL